MKQKLIEVKKEIDNSTLIIAFKTLLSVINRMNTQKLSRHQKSEKHYKHSDLIDIVYLYTQELQNLYNFQVYIVCSPR